MNARTSLRATIVKPEQALPIKPFGLDVKVPLTTEATRGAISVITACHGPGEGARPTTSISTRKRRSSSSRAPMS
jgi:hypothetical protein